MSREKRSGTAKRVLVLVFFILAILGRNITGAPNAQVAFSNYLQHGQANLTTSEASADHDALSQGIAISSSGQESLSRDDSVHKIYKKYLCPDRLLDQGTDVGLDHSRSPATTALERGNVFAVSLEVHAHAPPQTDGHSNSFSQFIIKGALNSEFSIDDQCSRGISLDGLRTS